MEDRLVEHLASLVGGRLVEVARPLEEFEGCDEDSAAGIEVVGGALDLVGDALFAFPHFLHACLDFVLRPFGVADEVEEAVFLAVKLGKLLPQGGTKVGSRLL